MAKFLVGVDEAGRGPIAGPVAVAAFCVSLKVKNALMDIFPVGKVRDSKKLSPAAREKIFKHLAREKTAGHVMYAVSFGSAARIDQHGIASAIRQALAESLEALDVAPEDCQVLLDGALRAPSHFPRQKTIIRGDETEAVIALASIVAKVSRDRLMVAFGKKHPAYDFEIHKGYGTKGHYAKIEKHGLCPIHRRSFLKGPSCTFAKIGVFF